jgi:hypothetical protein
MGFASRDAFFHFIRSSDTVASREAFRGRMAAGVWRGGAVWAAALLAVVQATCRGPGPTREEMDAWVAAGCSRSSGRCVLDGVGLTEAPSSLPANTTSLSLRATCITPAALARYARGSCEHAGRLEPA